MQPFSSHRAQHPTPLVWHTRRATPDQITMALVCAMQAPYDQGTTINSGLHRPSGESVHWTGGLSSPQADCRMRIPSHVAIPARTGLEENDEHGRVSLPALAHEADGISRLQIVGPSGERSRAWALAVHRLALRRDDPNAPPVRHHDSVPTKTPASPAPSAPATLQGRSRTMRAERWSRITGRSPRPSPAGPFARRGA